MLYSSSLACKIVDKTNYISYDLSIHTNAICANKADAIRVRVAVRLRPKNKEDFTDDGDFTSCVELQTEVLFV